MRIFFVIIVLVTCFTSIDVHAQVTVNEPSTGTLTNEQLAIIAEDINKILKNPLVEGSEGGRLALWKWIQSSPDITVTVCPTVIGPIAQSENQHKTMYVILSVLSSAAYLINNPNAELIDEQISAINGMLMAYEAVKKELGTDAEEPIMEELIRIRDKGELRSAVLSAMGDCSRANSAR